MKKLLLVLLVLITSSIPSLTHAQSCTIDEQILLNERPKNLSEREARDIIKKVTSSIAKTQTKEIVSVEQIWPWPKKNNIHRQITTEYYLKDQGNNKLPTWVKQEKNITETSDDISILTTLVVFLCINLFFGFLIAVNHSADNMGGKKNIKFFIIRLLTINMLWRAIASIVCMGICTSNLTRVDQELVFSSITNPYTQIFCLFLFIAIIGELIFWLIYWLIFLIKFIKFEIEAKKIRKDLGNTMIK
jgi:hypothetical protein